MFDVRLPREFKKNYLTQQNAMKVAGIASSNLYTNIAQQATKQALAKVIEKDSNRSFTDCINYVKNISEKKLEEFVKKARKFVR